MIRAAYRSAYGRIPAGDEVQAAERFLAERQRDGIATNPDAPRGDAVTDFCHALLNANEFLYID